LDADDFTAVTRTGGLLLRARVLGLAFGATDAGFFRLAFLARLALGGADFAGAFVGRFAFGAVDFRFFGGDFVVLF
jgi:hypothetical protein